MSVNELKDQGNKAFQAKDYDTAIELFSKAIELDENNFVLWSNRSAAKAGKKQWAAALDDAEQVCYALYQLHIKDLRLTTLVHQSKPIVVQGLCTQGCCVARSQTL